MGVFVHKTHRFAYKNEYKSPVSRLGFGIFSVLNSQWLAFTCRKDGQIADYSHHFLAISEPYPFHSQQFERLCRWSNQASAACWLQGRSILTPPLFHLHIDLEAQQLGWVGNTEIAGLIRYRSSKEAFPTGKPLCFIYQLISITRSIYQGFSLLPMLRPSLMERAASNSSIMIREKKLLPSSGYCTLSCAEWPKTPIKKQSRVQMGVLPTMGS